MGSSVVTNIPHSGKMLIIIGEAVKGTYIYLWSVPREMFKARPNDEY